MIKAAMESQYTFTTKEQDTFVQIKSGDSFEYRIRQVNGLFRVTQAYSERVWIKPTFKKVKDCASMDLALLAIVNRHNKACEHMRNWQPIATAI